MPTATALTAELDGGGVSGSLDLDPNGGFQLQSRRRLRQQRTRSSIASSDGRVWSPPVTVTLTICRGNAEADPANAATYAHANPAAVAEPAAARRCRLPSLPPSTSAAERAGLLPRHADPRAVNPEPQEARDQRLRHPRGPLPRRALIQRRHCPASSRRSLDRAAATARMDQPQPGLRLSVARRDRSGARPRRPGHHRRLRYLGRPGGHGWRRGPAGAPVRRTAGRRDGGLGAGRAAPAGRAESAAPSPALNRGASYQPIGVCGSQASSRLRTSARKAPTCAPSSTR